MSRRFLTFLSVLIVASTNSACNWLSSTPANADLKPATVSDINEALLSSAVRSSAAVGKLNTPGKTRSLNLQFNRNFTTPESPSLLEDTSHHHDQASLSNIYKAPEKIFHFSGRLLTNPDNVNRLPGIEGGEVSLEMRFK